MFIGNVLKKRRFFLKDTYSTIELEVFDFVYEARLIEYLKRGRLFNNFDFAFSIG
jgi:hypothetical protein